MNILEEIVQHKKNEVALAKATTAIRELEQSTLFAVSYTHLTLPTTPYV